MKFSNLIIKIYDDDIDDIINDKLNNLEEEYRNIIRNQYNKNKIKKYNENGFEIIDDDEDEILEREKNIEFLKTQKQINIIKEIKNNLSKELSLEEIINLPKEFDYTTFEIIDYEFVDDNEDDIDFDFELISEENDILELKKLINIMENINNYNINILYAIFEVIKTEETYNINEFYDILTDSNSRYVLNNSLRFLIEEYLRNDDVPSELWDYFDFENYENTLIDDWKYYNTSYGILEDTNAY